MPKGTESHLLVKENKDSVVANPRQSQPKNTREELNTVDTKKKSSTKSATHEEKDMMKWITQETNIPSLLERHAAIKVEIASDSKKTLAQEDKLQKQLAAIRDKVESLMPLKIDAFKKGKLSSIDEKLGIQCSEIKQILKRIEKTHKQEVDVAKCSATTSKEIILHKLKNFITDKKQDISALDVLLAGARAQNEVALPIELLPRELGEPRCLEFLLKIGLDGAVIQYLKNKRDQLNQLFISDEDKRYLVEHHWHQWLSLNQAIHVWVQTIEHTYVDENSLLQIVTKLCDEISTYIQAQDIRIQNEASAKLMLKPNLISGYANWYKGNHVLALQHLIPCLAKIEEIAEDFSQSEQSLALESTIYQAYDEKASHLGSKKSPAQPITVTTATSYYNQDRKTDPSSEVT